MEYWGIKLGTAPLDPGHDALGDGIDRLATAFDESLEARGPRASCNPSLGWVHCHFVVSADDFPDAVDKAIASFTAAVAAAGLADIELARVEVTRLRETEPPSVVVRTGVSAHSLS